MARRLKELVAVWLTRLYYRSPSEEAIPVSSSDPPSEEAIMGDASSEENVFSQKCVLCEVKASCCIHMGLPLCFDDRSAVRAWKRGRPAAEAVSYTHLTLPTILRV